MRWANATLPRTTSPARSTCRTRSATTRCARGCRTASAEIVTYCANPACQNSHVLAHRLQVLGYRNVAVFPGGKKEWTEAGLPLESATAATV